MISSSDPDMCTKQYIVGKFKTTYACEYFTDIIPILRMGTYATASLLAKSPRNQYIYMMYAITATIRQAIL